MERLEAVISGRVQGVWFRDFTHQAARLLGLTGSAENRSDGTVHVVAEGTKEKLESLLEKLHVGPPAATVERVDAVWKEAHGTHTTFTII